MLQNITSSNLRNLFAVLLTVFLFTGKSYGELLHNQPASDVATLTSGEDGSELDKTEIAVITFYGEATGKFNQLSWTAMVGEQTGAFLVERLASGSDTWTEVAVLPMQASDDLSAYNYVDTAPPAAARYRLRTTNMEVVTDLGQTDELIHDQALLF